MRGVLSGNSVLPCHIRCSRLVISNDERTPRNVTRRPVMQARMTSPVMIIPEALRALYALGAAAKKTAVPAGTIGLFYLRASHVNGCSVCGDMHTRELIKVGDTDERLFTVAALRDAP